MTVADRIRERRMELDLTQNDLAYRAGYTDKTSISKIENAGNDVTMKQVSRIAVALGVSPAYLMGWEDRAEETVEQAHEPMSGYINTADIPKALDMYEKYTNATPEVRAAIELLLRSSQSDV